MLIIDQATSELIKRLLPKISIALHQTNLNTTDLKLCLNVGVEGFGDAV